MNNITISDFQRKCSEFVNREVFLNMSYVVQEFVELSPESDLAMEAYYTVNGFDVEILESQIEDYQERISEQNDQYNGKSIIFLENPLRKRLEELENELDEANEGQEVFEHWAVSDFLRGKLEGQGEKVLDLGNLNIWCRTTTGQSISMDGVIELIVQNTFDEGKAKRLVQEMEEYPLLEDADEFFETGEDYE